MGEVVNIRDFKRKEEWEAADVRLAKQVMGLEPHSATEWMLDRIFGVTDTAPCEMPPVQPMYVAPTEDPA